MGLAPITTSLRHLFCVPPHTHALLRYRVHRVTPSHISFYTESGVAVDRMTGVDLPDAGITAADGPVALVSRDRVDVARAFEGAPPEMPTYYSSYQAFRQLQEVALVQYGTIPQTQWDAELELTVLRQRMMDAHPDQGGSEAAFTEARAAYEALRRRSGP